MNSKNRRHFDQLGSFKVIKNGAIRQITYDFLFAFHIKHMPTLCRFGDVKKNCVDIQSRKIDCHGNVPEGSKKIT